jgi:hypothetical protein
MADSHKHLAISAAEWGSFTQVLDGVCAALGVAADDAADLHAVVASMRADCTIADGEAAPRNPGKRAPRGKSLYARLGGVYPIALFADRLVDALLSDRTVRIPLGTSGRTVRLQLTSVHILLHLLTYLFAIVMDVYCMFSI